MGKARHDDAEWCEAILSLMKLRASGEQDEQVPDEAAFEHAMRLALRLSSYELLPPGAVVVGDQGTVCFVWTLEETTRRVVVDRDGMAEFGVWRKDGTKTFGMPVKVTDGLDIVLYAWLDSWISCFG